MKTNRIVSLLLPVLTLMFFYSCQAVDVVGKVGLKTFIAVSGDGARLVAPSTAEIFIIADDFSATDNDLVLSVNAGDFLAAGFDPSKLAADSFAPGVWSWSADTGILTLNYQVSDKPNKGSLSAADALIRNHPDRIGYHPQFDHYGFALGGGSMVEWAKDPATNDKDIVFVLNPEPFMAAGMDPSKLTVWLYGTVTVEDPKTKKPVEVTKLLRPYNL
jgi:hypothetical protein